MNPGKSILTHRFVQAMQYSFHLHARQMRKGTAIPYVSHLLGVTALVLEDGGDEDEAIAALLHDAVEDQGGHKTLNEIRLRFGERVAEIVEGCTDTFETPKPPWQQRKEDYIRHLKTASPSVRRVSLADKLHNARSILANLRTDGASTWKRFNGGREGTLWYYRSLLEVFQETDHSPMVAELGRVLAEIENIDFSSR
jgi:(p)ppGpp synthase/HD superfamily hydrolase